MIFKVPHNNFARLHLEKSPNMPEIWQKMKKKALFNLPKNPLFG
jgi:hypothetical protein